MSQEFPHIFSSQTKTQRYGLHGRSVIINIVLASELSAAIFLLTLLSCSMNHTTALQKHAYANKKGKNIFDVHYQKALHQN